MIHCFKYLDGGPQARWQEICQQQSEPLGRLFQRLADPSSEVRAEAEFLARRQGFDASDFFGAMKYFALEPGDASRLRAQDAFTRYLTQLYQPYNAKKLDSPLIKAQKLDFDSWIWTEQDELQDIVQRHG